MDFHIPKIWQILKNFAESSSINLLFLKNVSIKAMIFALVSPLLRRKIKPTHEQSPSSTKLEKKNLPLNVQNRKEKHFFGLLVKLSIIDGFPTITLCNIGPFAVVDEMESDDLPTLQK